MGSHLHITNRFLLKLDKGVSLCGPLFGSKLSGNWERPCKTVYCKPALTQTWRSALNNQPYNSHPTRHSHQPCKTETVPAPQPTQVDSIKLEPPRFKQISARIIPNKTRPKLFRTILILTRLNPTRLKTQQG